MSVASLRVPSKPPFLHWAARCPDLPHAFQIGAFSLHRANFRHWCRCTCPAASIALTCMCSNFFYQAPPESCVLTARHLRDICNVVCVFSMLPSLQLGSADGTLGTSGITDVVAGHVARPIYSCCSILSGILANSRAGSTGPVTIQLNLI